ncbi:hypothetical protein B0H66DRAFT_258057 [Apodospora peruviana]|uniref:Secreted protein n=1 Tax=Apodospora peruviana TaxID=516989 RepID=A0AAE0I622_9PEZI|nr:hypothetical protein B0H66DRAFT_258057 [Apodospora peruviana]
MVYRSLLAHFFFGMYYVISCLAHGVPDRCWVERDWHLVAATTVGLGTGHGTDTGTAPRTSDEKQFLCPEGQVLRWICLKNWNIIQKGAFGMAFHLGNHRKGLLSGTARGV